MSGEDARCASRARLGGERNSEARYGPGFGLDLARMSYTGLLSA
jgi:hypothetical protein